METPPRRRSRSSRSRRSGRSASRWRRCQAASGSRSRSPRRCMAKAKLVIMDEPTAALGVSQTRTVLDLIKRLASQGVAVLVVSHNLNDVFAVADRVVILYLGQHGRSGSGVGLRPHHGRRLHDDRALVAARWTTPRFHARLDRRAMPDEFSKPPMCRPSWRRRRLVDRARRGRDGRPGTDADLVTAAPEVLADSLGDYLRAQWRRIKSGESGALPVVVRTDHDRDLLPGRAIQVPARRRIWSTCSTRRRSTSCSAAAEIFALLLSEIDLSVGFVPPSARFVIAELIAPPVNFPWWLGHHRRALGVPRESATSRGA